jgi:hypothetical protein
VLACQDAQNSPGPIRRTATTVRRRADPRRDPRCGDASGVDRGAVQPHDRAAGPGARGEQERCLRPLPLEAAAAAGDDRRGRGDLRARGVRARGRRPRGVGSRGGAVRGLPVLRGAGGVPGGLLLRAPARRVRRAGRPGPRPGGDDPAWLAGPAGGTPGDRRTRRGAPLGRRSCAARLRAVRPAGAGQLPRHALPRPGAHRPRPGGRASRVGGRVPERTHLHPSAGHTPGSSIRPFGPATPSARARRSSRWSGRSPGRPTAAAEPASAARGRTGSAGGVR